MNERVYGGGKLTIIRCMSNVWVVCLVCPVRCSESRTPRFTRLTVSCTRLCCESGGVNGALLSNPPATRETAVDTMCTERRSQK